ncbi:MAG: Arc family DNA binding domain-containing protein [Ignavibacteriae bacterium]|nr:Arc family DNA binding domain-containing protein [Ignavibacteriota bacterium]MCB9208265.1 Arc family DNA binding domain-containing protein [Ignavibacteriales bacterium]MCB9259027.1 Arc family DNA binding domain-containing protein [Ignavibacteriales bacterium]
MAQKKAVILRIDPKLWKDLNIWAKDELRSLNGQIEYVLREAIKRRTGEKDKN